MVRRACKFSETDVKRAVHAVEAAGQKVATVEIDEGGRIKITTRNGNGADDKNDDNTSTNPWDEVDLK